MAVPYKKGLHDLGNGLFAYLQPDGSWGWSNAGLVTSGNQSLLVDTLWDLKLTAEMLDEMARATPAAKKIDTLVNTHANGDHCWGNQLVSGAEIIASAQGAAEMQEFTPDLMVKLMKVAKGLHKLGPIGQAIGGLAGKLGLKKLAALAEGAPYVLDIFGPFQFEGIQLEAPTRTFDGTLQLRVGDLDVELIELGPAHTRGDVVAYVPSAKTLFAGDLLFINGHPIVWEGPFSNWIRACDRILEMDLETIVPGHGPLTDKAGVKKVREYLAFVESEARKRFEAGMDVETAARDIALDDFNTWSDVERMVVNVDTAYREMRGQPERTDVVELFGQMARLRKDITSKLSSKSI